MQMTTIPKQALVFMCLQYKSFENIVGKGEIAHIQQFLLFTWCFLPAWRNFTIFIKFKIVVCKLVQFGSVLKVLFGERVNGDKIFRLAQIESICRRQIKCYSEC